jgi:hypothetical protein
MIYSCYKERWNRLLCGRDEVGVLDELAKNPYKIKDKLAKISERLFNAFNIFLLDSLKN